MKRLTAEFLKKNTVAFFPASAGEALYLQQRLASMGMRWNGGGAVYTPEKVVALGLIVQRGTMFTGAADVFQEYIVADVRQVSKHVDTGMQALEDRIAALEAEVAALRLQLEPKSTKLSPAKKGFAP